MIKSHVELAAASEQAVVSKYESPLGKADETKHTHTATSVATFYHFLLILVLLPHQCMYVSSAYWIDMCRDGCNH